MAGSLRHRCLLYLDGLTQEAVHCGYGVQAQPIDDCHRRSHTTYGRPGVPGYFRREGELNIVVNHFFYRITIDQQHPEAEDDERYDQLYVWAVVPAIPLTAVVPAGATASGPPSTIRSHRCWARPRAGAVAAQRKQDDCHALWQANMDEPPGLPPTTAWSPSWNSGSAAGGRSRNCACTATP